MCKFFKFLKKPPMWFIILNFCITFIFATTSLVLLINNLGETFYAYIIYAFAGLSLSYAVYFIVLLAPKMKKLFIDTLKKYKLTRKIYEDYSFRTIVFSCLSLAINFCFGVFEIVIGAIGKSIWFGSLGLYHLILSATRFAVIYRYNQQTKKHESDMSEKLRTYQNCGVCILIFNIALAGAMGQMIFSWRAFEYAGLMIFVFATLAFYKIIASIIGIFNSKKHKDYETQALRNINLTDAMVSLYALQTTLIATFSKMGNDMAFMNMATGIVVTLLSLGLGIFMIIKAQKEKNKIKE